MICGWKSLALGNKLFDQGAFGAQIIGDRFADIICRHQSGADVDAAERIDVVDIDRLGTELLFDHLLVYFCLRITAGLGDEDHLILGVFDGRFDVLHQDRIRRLSALCLTENGRHTAGVEFADGLDPGEGAEKCLGMRESALLGDKAQIIQPACLMETILVLLQISAWSRPVGSWRRDT